MENATPKIPPKTLKEWEHALAQDAFQATEFYFENILPTVVAYHRQKPDLVPQYELLVSLMGLSPETTVLAVAMVRPQKLIILASENTSKHCDLCRNFLVQHSLLKKHSVQVRFIDPVDHQQLHDKLMVSLKSTKGSRIVDLTGGKKIMSAVAGYVAWSLGLPICYLDSQLYNQTLRRPEPGSETLRVMNPPDRG
jgi:hypothetical protein